MVYTYEIFAHGDPKLSVFVKSRWVQQLKTLEAIM